MGRNRGELEVSRVAFLNRFLSEERGAARELTMHRRRTRRTLGSKTKLEPAWAVGSNGGLFRGSWTLAHGGLCRRAIRSPHFPFKLHSASSISKKRAHDGPSVFDVLHRFLYGGPAADGHSRGALGG